MDIEFRRAGIELQEQQLLRLENACGACITCRNGTLWVTQEGIAQDDFLNPGDTLALVTAEVVLLQAVVPATFVIEAPARRKAGSLRTLWFFVLPRSWVPATVPGYRAGVDTAASMASNTLSLVSNSGSRVGAASSLPARYTA